MRRRVSLILAAGLCLLIGINLGAAFGDASETFTKKGEATFEILPANKAAPTDTGKNTNVGKSTSKQTNSNYNAAQPKPKGRLPSTNSVKSFLISFIGGLLLMFFWIIFWIRRRSHEK